MISCRDCEMLFDEYSAEELSDSEMASVSKHLESCPNCSRNFSEQEVITKPHKRVEPSEDFWEGFTDRLHSRMVEEGVVEESGTTTEKKRKSFEIFTLSWLKQSIAAAAVLVIGIFIGSIFFSQSGELGEDSRNSGLMIASDDKSEGALLTRASHFINRSRVILLAIDNFDPETEEAGVMDFAYQKSVTSDLVKEAALLKEGLGESRQRRLKELISDLEVILLQLANYDKGMEVETIKMVKDNRYINGVLYRIRVNDLRRETNKRRVESY